MASCKLGSYLYLMLCLSTQRIALHCNIFKMSRYWGKQLKMRSSRPSLFKFVSFPKGRIVTNNCLTAVWVATCHLIWQRRSSIGFNKSLVRFTSPCNRTLEPDFVWCGPFRLFSVFWARANSWLYLKLGTRRPPAGCKGFPGRERGVVARFEGISVSSQAPWNLLLKGQYWLI